MNFKDLNIDLDKLTKAQKLDLLKELSTSLKVELNKPSELSEPVSTYEKEVSVDEIEKLINKHFDEYDEVFRALA